MRIFSLFKLWEKKIFFVRQSKTHHYYNLIENRGWKREWLVYLLDKSRKVVVINDLPIVWEDLNLNLFRFLCSICRSRGLQSLICPWSNYVFRQENKSGRRLTTCSFWHEKQTIWKTLNTSRNTSYIMSNCQQNKSAGLKMPSSAASHCVYMFVRAWVYMHAPRGREWLIWDGDITGNNSARNSIFWWR